MLAKTDIGAKVKTLELKDLGSNLHLVWLCAPVKFINYLVKFINYQGHD